MKEKTIEINGKSITIKELTARQVDALFDNASADRPASTAELLLNASMPLEAVIASTGMTEDALNGDITPSDLHQIWEAVGEVNGFLSQLLERLGRAAIVLQKQQHSNETSAA